MRYNRDEVIASVTDFYTFLTTHLHFDPSQLKTPPPAGWPQITPDRSSELRKSDTVIDLLRHLPYLPGGNDEEKWIEDHTLCADYTLESVELDIEHSIPANVEYCPWDKLKDTSRQEHIVALGVPETDVGSLILLDTLDGEVVVWDIDELDYCSFDSAGMFYTWLRERYEELEIFPVPKTSDVPSQVMRLRPDRHQGFKDIIRSLGWPPRDGGEWKREEGMKEAGRVAPEYMYL